MRRALPLVLALVLLIAAPAEAAKRSSTPVRITAPAAANATVAGFELDLVRVKKKTGANASAAAALPKNVSIYAVVAKQKRSDRVRGVLVAVDRASAVTTASIARRLTVTLKHAAVPKGYKIKLKVRQAVNVLGHHRALKCSRYFKGSDLGGAVMLGGPRLPNITIGTIIQSACAAARSGKPFATLGEFRSALNAPSGSLTFVMSTTAPNEVNGTATFNYTTRAFGVMTDATHQLTGCAFTAGTCTITSNYASFTLTAPAAAGTQMPFSLALSPNPTPRLPFQFFGFDTAGHRLGPLLTSGP
jgi:hypothetical protein